MRMSMEDRVGGDNVSWRWRHVAGPSQRMYLVEPSAETSAECSQSLATLTKKAKKSVHRRSQAKSMYWKVFTNQVMFFWLPVLYQQRTISDTCSTCPTHMRNAHRYTGAWYGARQVHLILWFNSLPTNDTF